jgi:hypothetical protein
VVAAALAAACGGSPSPGAGQSTQARAHQAGSPTSTVETRWLRGLWASDIRSEVGKIGLTCKGPDIENRSSVWSCEGVTPLVSYRLRFYGSAPGKIEYLHAVVEQSGPAKDALPLRLFGVLAGLHFDGADPAKARVWLQTAMAAGGTTAIGPAKYKLAGDPNRREFDVKASGSEW